MTSFVDELGITIPQQPREPRKMVTEAETVWLTDDQGRACPGYVLGYDQETGLGLVQALATALAAGITGGWCNAKLKAP